jgi:hypothetical protein
VAPMKPFRALVKLEVRLLILLIRTVMNLQRTVLCVVRPRLATTATYYQPNEDTLLAGLPVGFSRRLLQWFSD